MDDCHSEDILFDFDYADDLDALRELEEDGEFIGMLQSILCYKFKFCYDVCNHIYDVFSEKCIEILNF